MPENVRRSSVSAGQALARFVAARWKQLRGRFLQVSSSEAVSSSFECQPASFVLLVLVGGTTSLFFVANNTTPAVRRHIDISSSAVDAGVVGRGRLWWPAA